MGFLAIHMNKKKMSDRDDKRNPVTQSLKKFAQEQYSRPSKNTEWKIGESEPFSGKVNPEQYGAVGDPKKQKNK